MALGRGDSRLQLNSDKREAPRDKPIASERGYRAVVFALAGGRWEPYWAVVCWLRSLCGAVTRILRYMSRNTLESSTSLRASHVFCRDAPIRFAKSCCVMFILTD